MTDVHQRSKIGLFFVLSVPSGFALHFGFPTLCPKLLQYLGFSLLGAPEFNDSMN